MSRRVPTSADGGIKFNPAKYGDIRGGFCTYQPANVPLCGALQQAAILLAKLLAF